MTSRASPAARALPWREPAAVASALAGLPGSVALLSDGGPQGRWSYVMAEPDAVETVWPDDPRDGLALLRDLLGPVRPVQPDGPPFRGGVIGLLAYEYGARLERGLDLPRVPAWPDLSLARYGSVLAFDHPARAVHAIGPLAVGWLQAEAGRAPPSAPLAVGFDAEMAGPAYEAAVADVVGRIEAGEIFQANIARAWTGALAAGADPADLIARLAAASPAPFAAWWRGDGLALASNSPERFVRLDAGADGRFTVETRPIKGTRPRGADPAADAALAAELMASEKDRAENLMIVDLMRNDLSRVCEAVETPELFRAEAYANVHHLVSTVTGRMRPGLDAADLLRATFPPGSITGAPKVQAMRVIAGHEPPRGPWCGSLFWAGFDGAMDSSVLIRTAAFVETEAGGGWRFRASAGAGIVADSAPVAERLETETKIAALRRALTEPA